MSNPYSLFETDKQAEQEGVKIDYGDFWFQIARVGGSNEKFNNRLKALLNPYRRAIETETMDSKVQERLTTQTFIETALLGWGSKEHGEGKMIGRDGKALPFTKENATQLFEDLPDLLLDLIRTGSKMAVFRKSLLEDDLGNFGSS